MLFHVKVTSADKLLPTLLLHIESDLLDILKRTDAEHGQITLKILSRYAHISLPHGEFKLYLYQFDIRINVVIDP